MSHNCENEHFSHGHDHGGHGHGHGHDHDDEAPLATNAQQSLYQYIDTTKSKLLNAVALEGESLLNTDQKYAAFIKPTDQKFDIQRSLKSDIDCQMAIQIQFTGSCRIKSIILRCNKPELSEEFDAPKTIEIYKNWKRSVNLDFDNLASKKIKPDMSVEYPKDIGIDPTTTEKIDLNEDSMIEYHMTKGKFNDCHSFTLFFKDNWTSDEDNLCKLYYLEIRGDYIGKIERDNTVPIVSVYESAPNPLDHQKVESSSDKINLGL
ncbi:hypothetical protein DAKH74_002080 [Maudiozyma humilis]|uniref:PITH domain-containing protein n=1 Tax=Maudiozyma humilis TaxID=51915 RepID=A0AAV5RR20_MAUHU|nr:hypothetical protein DAKH74_002080 [Kazachstania humilis]